MLAGIPGLLFWTPRFGTSVEFVVMPIVFLLIRAIGASLVIGALSLILFGVILFPVGIAIGLLLPRLRRATIDESPSDSAGYDSTE